MIGGTGQVGAAVMRALAAEPSCAEVVMVNRRTASLTGGVRVRQVVMDTAAAQFPAEVATLARDVVRTAPAPPYGTRTMSSFAVILKSSAERSGVVPIPAVAMLSFFPSFTSATMSCIDFTATDGCAVKTFGEAATLEIGTK